MGKAYSGEVPLARRLHIRPVQDLVAKARDFVVTEGSAAGGGVAVSKADGELLTWLGRDPEYEDKHRKWEAAGKVEREPEKFHFVKGFHRGIELFGQHALRAPEAFDKLKTLGLILVEGPNDVIRLDSLGVHAVALCSNRIGHEQAERAARLARELAGGIVNLILDCDREGEEGIKQCLGSLAQLCPVRLAWTSEMYGGKFKGRQPESLEVEEWSEIEAFLMTGKLHGVARSQTT